MRRLAIIPGLVVALFSVASAEATRPAPASSRPAASDATSETMRWHPNWFTEEGMRYKPRPAASYFRTDDMPASACRSLQTLIVMCV
jgi:hypothetical protein